MGKELVFDDDADKGQSFDPVSVSLRARIRKLRPEWFEGAPLPAERKRGEKVNLQAKFNIVSTRHGGAVWQGKLSDFIAFETRTRVYQ